MAGKPYTAESDDLSHHELYRGVSFSEPHERLGLVKTQVQVGRWASGCLYVRADG